MKWLLAKLAAQAVRLPALRSVVVPSLVAVAVSLGLDPQLVGALEVVANRLFGS